MEGDWWGLEKPRGSSAKCQKGLEAGVPAKSLEWPGPDSVPRPWARPYGAAESGRSPSLISLEHNLHLVIESGLGVCVGGRGGQGASVLCPSAGTLP